VNMDAEHDPNDVTEVAWALWAGLMCRCDRCGTMLDLGHDALLDESPKEWADLVAPIAKSNGWTAPDNFSVRCLQCTKASSQ
jgi:hypothetical protein